MLQACSLEILPRKGVVSGLSVKTENINGADDDATLFFSLSSSFTFAEGHGQSSVSVIWIRDPF